MTLGSVIKLYRTQGGITQGELSRLTGLSISYLSLLERNKRNPNISTLQKIADGLSVPLIMIVFLMDINALDEINSELAQKVSYIALNYTKGQSNG